MNKTLSEKLKIKSGNLLLLLDAPKVYEDELSALAQDFKMHTQIISNPDVIQLFVTHGKDLINWIEKLLPCFKNNPIFWVTYPKKPSGIATDLGMMHHWDELTRFGMRPVSAISINENWTALQVKNNHEVKKSASSKSEIEKSSFSEFINQQNRTVKLPDDLETVLNKEHEALNFFYSLSFTNQKEYVIWILSTKQLKTREERIKNTFEKLKNRKKNPSEK